MFLLKFFPIFLISYSALADYSIVSQKDDNSEQVLKISEEDYKKLLAENLRQSVEFSNKLGNTRVKSFRLEAFSIGFGVDAEAELGPFGRGIGIKNKLIFKREE
jgi:hypothetical protein